MATDAASDLFEQAGAAWNVDPALLRAQQAVESGGDDHAVSNKGAQGRMQLMPQTAAALGVTDTSDPAQSIFGAAKLMRQNLDAANGDVVTALKLYQGGPDRTKWGPQNAAYPVQVLTKMGFKPGQQQAATQVADATPAPATDAFSAAIGAAPPANDDATLDATMSKLRAAQGAPAQPASAPVAPAQDAFSAAAPAQAASPAPAQDAFSAAIAVPAAAAASAAPTDAVAASAPTTPQQPLLARVGAGLQQGVMDVAGTGAKAVANAAQWVDSRVPALASLDQSVGLNPAQVAPGVNALTQQYEQQYGNDPAANLARVGGQIVTTLPVMGAANGAAGLLGRAAYDGTGEAFLTGQLGNGLMRAPSLAAQGAIMGAASNVATGNDPATGAAMGALAGPVSGALTGAGVAAYNKLLGRGASAISPEVAQLADLAQTKYKIPLRADQLSGSGAVKVAGDAVNRLPFTGGTQFTENQLSAYNRAVAATIGENADALTPQVMSNAKQRIGAMFDHVENNVTVPVESNTQFTNTLAQIETAAHAMPGDAGLTITNQINEIISKAADNNGDLPGDVFRGFVKTGTPLDRLTKSNDPNVAYYAGQVKSAMQDALEASLPPGSPILQEYQQARQQYRSLQTIKNMAAKAPTGTVSPALMMGAALRNDPQMAFTGGGDLGELAKIGQQFLKAPPNSTTAERNMVLNALMSAGQLGAAGLMGYGGNEIGGLPGAALSGGAALVAGTALAHRLQDPALVNRLIQSGMQVRLPAVGNALMRQVQPYLSGGATLALPQPAK